MILVTRSCGLSTRCPGRTGRSGAVTSSTCAGESIFRRSGLRFAVRKCDKTRGIRTKFDSIKPGLGLDGRSAPTGLVPVRNGGRNGLPADIRRDDAHAQTAIWRHLNRSRQR